MDPETAACKKNALARRIVPPSRRRIDRSLVRTGQLMAHVFMGTLGASVLSSPPLPALGLFVRARRAGGETFVVRSGVSLIDASD